MDNFRLTSFMDNFRLTSFMDNFRLTSCFHYAFQIFSAKVEKISLKGWHMLFPNPHMRKSVQLRLKGTLLKPCTVIIDFIP